jgi:carbohydrate-binding DOMON domain-containing protein
MHLVLVLLAPLQIKGAALQRLTHMHAHTHTYTHTQALTHTRTNTHTHIRTHTHEHKEAPCAHVRAISLLPLALPLFTSSEH